MRVLVTGASGLIGSAIVAELTLGGHEVYTLGRRRTSDPKNLVWDLDNNLGDLGTIETLDAVIHLSGESIGNKRWTDSQKSKIWDSRVKGTALLVDLLTKANLNPDVFIGASATGFYGDRGTEELTESSHVGSGFLAALVQRWEEETNKATSIAKRVVLVRSGIVQSSYGGALAKQLPLFRFGLGAALGSGKQYLSWIHLEDEVAAILFALTSDAISGPINLVSPNPITNLEYSKIISKVLHRPMILKIPAKVLELALGKEFAREMLLASQRVFPNVLQEAGFEFRFPTLENALRDLLR